MNEESTESNLLDEKWKREIEHFQKVWKKGNSEEIEEDWENAEKEISGKSILVRIDEHHKLDLVINASLNLALINISKYICIHFQKEVTNKKVILFSG